MIKVWQKLSLIQRILIGILIGILLGLAVPQWTWLSILGELFVDSLKAIAPLLVFFIIMSSLSRHEKGTQTHMTSIIILYLLATFVAALAAVGIFYLFPVKIVLPQQASDVVQAAPEDLMTVVKNIFVNGVANPIAALAEGNYLALLFWGSLLGLALRNFSDQTKKVVTDISGAISLVIQLIIQLAPFGIIGLVYNSVVSTGVEGLLEYGKLVIILVGTMLFVSFVIYPLMVAVMIRENPYPLTFYCFKESGIPAFFTRSSAVNIPINMNLAEKLGLNEKSYALSIPLGAAANSGGAAITISLMTLAAAYTLGMEIPFVLALILCFLTAISATGASGIAGGSLLLIPLACSLFGISNDIAMQVVGVGFIIGVIQDSVETAVNSASDLLFTATAEYHDLKKAGVKINVKEQVKKAQQRLQEGKVEVSAED